MPEILLRETLPTDKSAEAHSAYSGILQNISKRNDYSRDVPVQPGILHLSHSWEPRNKAHPSVTPPKLPERTQHTALKSERQDVKMSKVLGAHQNTAPCILGVATTRSTSAVTSAVDCVPGACLKFSIVYPSFTILRSQL